MWAKNGNIAKKRLTWYEAMAWVRGLSYADYIDWRLPTRDEFNSFVLRGGELPCHWFNMNGFYAVQDWYWSSSSNSGFPEDSAFPTILWGSDGVGGPHNKKTCTFYAWPVRDVLCSENYPSFPTDDDYLYK